jgi:hypothetical protein
VAAKNLAVIKLYKWSILAEQHCLDTSRINILIGLLGFSHCRFTKLYERMGFYRRDWRDK